MTHKYWSGHAQLKEVPSKVPFPFVTISMQKKKKKSKLTDPF